MSRGKQAAGQSDATKALAQVFLLVIPVFVLAGMPSNALRGAGEFLRWNIIRVLGPGLWLVAIVLSRSESVDHVEHAPLDRLTREQLAAHYEGALVVVTRVEIP